MIQVRNRSKSFGTAGGERDLVRVAPIATTDFGLITDMTALAAVGAAFLALGAHFFSRIQL